MTNNFATGVAGAALVIAVLALFVSLRDDNDPAPAQADVTTVAPGTTSAITARPVPTTASNTLTVSGTVPVVTAAPETTLAPTSTIATTDTADDLPGEPSEFGPAAGTQLGVVGVRHNSLLNVRDAPNGAIVATLNLRIGGQGDGVLQVRDPDADEVVASLGVDGLTATGRSRDLSTTTWLEIQAGPIFGWASGAYLAPLSPDIRLNVTGEVTSQLGRTPTSSTLTGLGNTIAGVFKSEEPPSDVAVSGAPGESGGVARITIDVVGLPDDSLRGYRLLITATSSGGSSGDDDTDAEPQTFTLQGVFATPLCYSERGVSDSGSCN
ncbi:hypothetical protein [Candidatus Poriferisodalis sp.]|uniref:hypothetical protein n=1 Tax=Candidatus Poriferisodalis sp. TaxID=3101277 RepID=UPI003B018468